jgi:hypothetical protein
VPAAVPEPASPLPSAFARLRAWVEAHPKETATVLYIALAAAMVPAAYVALFSIFSGWDDEGTLLVSVQAFAEGKALYTDVYSPYGPFYYELFGGFFALTGWAITNEASRWIVIGVWILASLLFGLATQRLTGRLLLGLTGMLVAFNLLDALVFEPMHPHGICDVLLGAFVLLAVSFPSRRLLAAGGLAGALLAALVLTKVNLGAYAIAAVALAAVLTVEPLHRRGWLRWAVIAAFLAMPLVIISRDLGEEWARSLIAMEVLASAAVVVAAWPLRPRRGESDAQLVDWLIAGATGFAAAFGAILLAIVLTGPSLADVADGALYEATQVRQALTIPFNSAAAAVDWGIAALAVAVLVSWLRPTAAGRPSAWPGALRLAAGLAIWFSITQTSPLAFGPAPGNPVALPLMLAWVAAVAPVGVVESAGKRFLRVLLPALAVAETLQVYPVAGAQVVDAALIYVPVGALCIADGLDGLRAWSAAAGAATLRRFGIVATVAVVALLAKFAMDFGRTATRVAGVYSDQQALTFPGADQVRLPAEQADEYEAVVDLLRKHRCTNFIGYPNINSFYLWTGIKPPIPSASGTWITVLDEAQQRRVVAQLRATPRPCAIRNETQASMWLSGRPRPNTPLSNYIFDRFAPTETVGQFEFLLPKN